MFEQIEKFEYALAQFTGATYAITTDCCTHAIELCLRYDRVARCAFTPFTYISVPMTMHKLGINYSYHDHRQQSWIGEYQFTETRIWDSARLLTNDMYRPGMLQCLSFGFDKPLNAGRGGAILLDDATAYHALKKMRYDGRDLSITPWVEQAQFTVGYHYKLNPEECITAHRLLENYIDGGNYNPKNVSYPDCRRVTIV